MDPLGREGLAASRLVQALQHAASAAYTVVLTANAKASTAIAQLYTKARFNLFEMLIQWTAQIRQPLVVIGRQLKFKCSQMTYSGCAKIAFAPLLEIILPRYH